MPAICTLHARAYPRLVVLISVIVCAHNEEAYIVPALLSLLGQARPPDEILVINNASTDRTRAVAAALPGVRVVDEPNKGLVIARERGRREAHGRHSRLRRRRLPGAAHVARAHRASFRREARISIALSGSYRFYDWDWWGRSLARAYDLTLAPLTHVLVKYILRIGVVFYGGNFAVRREALARIGGFDTSIEFHGEDTNLGRRLAEIGPVELRSDCYLYTSARRYNAMGKGAVFRLYVRNFVSELIRHRPSDREHVDVRTLPND